jgi:four helix bundle protein
MATIAKFTDLNVWKEAHKLTLLIYKYSSTFPKSETFGLTSQIRRAVVSIESNIAEGFSRFHYKDRLVFYYDARGSISEVQCQTIISKDVKYVNQSQFEEIWKQSELVAIILGGLIKSTLNISKKKV